MDLVKKITTVLTLILVFVGYSIKANSQSLPKPKHVVIVIEENHGFDQIIGSKAAPYINHLANEGALFTNAHGVTHPSQPNYIAIYSGDIQGVTDDHCIAKDKRLRQQTWEMSLSAKGIRLPVFRNSSPKKVLTVVGLVKVFSNMVVRFTPENIIPGLIGRTPPKMEFRNRSIRLLRVFQGILTNYLPFLS